MTITLDRLAQVLQEHVPIRFDDTPALNAIYIKLPYGGGRHSEEQLVYRGADGATIVIDLDEQGHALGLELVP